MDTSSMRPSTALGALVLLVVAGTLTLAGCFGTSASGPTTAGTAVLPATSSASAAVAPASSSPLATAGAPRLPASRWDAPGSATLAQTLAVAHRYAVALHTETIARAGLYAASATWDYWPADNHLRGGAAIARIYREGAVSDDWSRNVHIMAAPGVGVCEGVVTNMAMSVYTKPSAPFVTLLAVDGDKVMHEEVFHDTRIAVHRPVQFYRSAPEPDDTARVASQVGAAVADAFAAADPAGLRTLHGLMAPGVLFYDTAHGHGERGWAAMLRWWARLQAVVFESRRPIAGPGWAVVRWTARRMANGVERAVPGATVMEVRGGRIVRLTLYYDSRTVSLQ
jgi:hypothetical protein